jgi:hypothetical protein
LAAFDLGIVGKSDDRHVAQASDLEELACLAPAVSSAIIAPSTAVKAQWVSALKFWWRDVSNRSRPLQPAREPIVTFYCICSKSVAKLPLWLWPSRDQAQR